MPDTLERTPESPEKPDRPVLTGLVALIVVALVVGALAGVTLLVGSRVTGLGGSSAGGGASEHASMVIPTRESKKSSPGPLISAGPDDAGDGKGSDKPKTTISLQAAQTSVGSGGQIDLSGAYPGASGVTLQVQRFQGGKWADFPVDVNVGAGNFSTYVVTSQSGPNKFRVYDPAADLASNEVTVRVG